MIYAIVVLYNKKCEDSNTIQSLMNVKDIPVFLFDNSTTDYGNRSFCSRNNIEYYGDKKNRGLSFAYNYLIDKINAKPNDILIMLDDDTDLDIDYFQTLRQSESDSHIDVFLPVVYANDLLLSPSNTIWRGIPRPVKSIAQLNISTITAINSGMAVRNRVFQYIKYNEELFLDCVDHDFMNSVHSMRFNIKVLECSIEQHYSRKEKKTLEQYLARFQLYRKDFKTYSRKNRNMAYYYISIAFMRTKSALLYKNISLLWK